MFGGFGTFGCSPEQATNIKCETGSSKNCVSLVPGSAEEFRNSNQIVGSVGDEFLNIFVILDCGLYNTIDFLSLQEGHC